MACELTMKYIFLFLYSITNISTAFFFTPILFHYIKEALAEISWIYIALYFSSYELGRLLGNLLWIRINRIFSSAIVLLCSLIPLTILHISFCFITSITSMLIHRTLVGIFNCLTLISKRLLTDLSMEKKTKNIYIITSITSCLSVFIPCLNNNVISIIPKEIHLFTIKVNQFTPSSLFLAVINIITIIFVVIISQMKMLKLKTSNNFMEMNVIEGNDVTHDIVKKKSSFNIKKSAEISAERTTNDKNSHRFETEKVDENFPKIDKRDSTDMIKNKVNNEKSVMNNNDNNNIIINNNTSSFKESVNNDNPITSPHLSAIATTTNDNSTSIKKPVILSLIYSLLQGFDIYLFTTCVIMLYVHYNERIITLCIGMLIFYFIYALVNFPIIKVFIKATNSKEAILKHINRALILCFIGDISLGFSLFYYCLNYTSTTSTINTSSYVNFKLILLFTLCFFLIIFKKILHSILTRCYQLYIAVDLSEDIKAIKDVNEYQNNFSALAKILFSLISSMSYYFLGLHDNKDSFRTINSVLFFILFPGGMFGILFMLIKCNMKTI